MTIMNLFKVAALVEIATGVAIIINPLLVTLLLFGAELTGVGPVLGRVTGLGLFSLGIACWPIQQTADRTHPPLWAIFIYGIFVTAYLVYIAINGQWVGWLLWPAASLHAILPLLLAWKWRT